MALLSTQLVITLVIVSLMQKIGLYFSFGRWLLCSTKLTRFLYPTDTQLRQIANIPKEKSKRNSKHTENGKKYPNTFNVPRNLDIELETTKVTSLDVIHLRYYTEYQWLVDFALYSALVYLFTELYHNWFSLNEEINLSMMWCLLVIGFATKLLFTLTVQYFKGEQSIGERSTCIVMGFIYFFISMVILIVDENTLELNLQQAYKSFNDNALVFLNNQGLSTAGPASKIVLQFFIALWCGLIGALFTFPGLRIAKMHWDLIRFYSNSKMKQFFLNISIAIPFLLVLLWVKPVSRHYLTVRIFSGMSSPLMEEYRFESLRLLLVVVSIFIRICLMPLYLQAYLNMAHDRIEEQKKEAGRITNIDLQRKIAAVFYYLCVVALQYIAPLIMCLYFTFMYKTLGGYTWSGLFFEPDNYNECPVTVVDNTILKQTESVQYSAEQFHLAMNSLKSVFTEDVFRGIFGFATWWSCFTWFATTSVGMIYQSYFAHS